MSEWKYDPITGEKLPEECEKSAQSQEDSCSPTPETAQQGSQPQAACQCQQPTGPSPIPPVSQPVSYDDEDKDTKTIKGLLIAAVVMLAFALVFEIATLAMLGSVSTSSHTSHNGLPQTGCDDDAVLLIPFDLPNIGFEIGDGPVVVPEDPSGADGDVVVPESSAGSDGDVVDPRDYTDITFK